MMALDWVERAIPRPEPVLEFQRARSTRTSRSIRRLAGQDRPVASATPRERIEEQLNHVALAMVRRGLVRKDQEFHSVGR